MDKKRYKIYLEDNFDEGMLDTLCDLFPGASFFYGNKYLKYYGYGEGLEALKRFLASYGIKVKEVK